uniref:Uncharacterized protein n=1 Tax=Euplotes crassus TaxID=5936 RepID=A0A7S3NQ51_EUPCR|mmetsp:Transcript_104/g.107  ORF Transcript_104/g.107 Transcript_104/m.107 type:complete len:106 (+) Transcript_104:503-820(+)
MISNKNPDYKYILSAIKYRKKNCAVPHIQKKTTLPRNLKLKYYKSEDEGADHEETQKRLLSRNSLNSLEEPDKIAKMLRKQDNGWMDTGLENNGEERSTNLEKIL